MNECTRVSEFCQEHQPRGKLEKSWIRAEGRKADVAGARAAEVKTNEGMERERGKMAISQPAVNFSSLS